MMKKQLIIFSISIFTLVLSACESFPTEINDPDPRGLEGHRLLWSGYGYYHKIGDCDPRVFVRFGKWSSATCTSRREQRCLVTQLEYDKKACSEGPAAKSKFEQMALCKDTTKLKVGMSKKQVQAIFGEPTYSKMDTCGGAQGVKRWSCEILTYACNSEPDSSDMSSVTVWFSGNHANNWE